MRPLIVLFYTRGECAKYITLNVITALVCRMSNEKLKKKTFWNGSPILGM